MLGRGHSPIDGARRSLAAVVVLLISFMSSAVSPCEVSCLFDDGQCAGVSPRASTRGTSSPWARSTTQATEEVGSPLHDMTLGSTCDEELCEEASVTAMLPNDRLVVSNNANSNVWPLAAADICVLTLPGREDSRNDADSLPPKVVAASPLLISLRI